MSDSFTCSLRLGARLLLGCCLVTPAFAQEAPGDSVPLGTLLLRTDRAGGEVLDQPANVTVIDGDQIEDRQIADMQSLVRNVPGVSVGRQTSTADPFSTFGGFTIRGVGGNRVAIQMDGSRVAERIIDGTRDYLDFNFTKQVEIVRGPASVLWGADALGGLVAMETLDPEDLLEGRDRAVNLKGGFDSFEESGNVALTFGQRLSPDLSLLVGLARETKHEPELSNARDDGGIYGCPRNLSYGATPCGSIDPMTSDSTRGLVKLVWTPGTRHRLEFSADLLQRDTAVDQNYALGPTVSTITGLPTGEIVQGKGRKLDLNRQRYAIEHTYTPESGLLSELRTTLAYAPHSYTRTGTERSTSAAGDRIFARDELKYAEDFVEFDLQARSDFSTGAADHRVIMGFDGDIAWTDYERRDIANNLTTGTMTETRAGGFNFANATTTRADIYIEDRISFWDGRFELTPGLRYATYEIDPRPDSDYLTVPGKAPRKRKDEALLKSLGAMYRIDDNWSVWAKYGEGFKMPTAQQLYTSLPSTFFNLIPAPDLEPEEVESYEVGLRFEHDRGFASINAFQADYSNFIQSFYQIPGTIDITYRNISKVKVWGIEAAGSWDLSERTQLGFSAAWQKGRQRLDPTAAKTPHTLPPLTASLSLSHYIPAYSLMLEGVATFAGDVEETANANDFKPDGYAILDLYAKWEVVDNGFLKLGIQNVFDRRYFTANAATYSDTASTAVAIGDPIELQTGPGRTFSISFDKTF